MNETSYARRAQEARQRENKQAEEAKAREEKARQEAERKREEERRKEDERRRADQNRVAGDRQREADQQGKDLNEAAVRIQKEQKEKNEQAQYAKDKGVAYVDGRAVVADYYRNINAARRPDGQAADRTQQGNAQGKTQTKDSPAVARYKAHQQAIAGKVQERLTTKQVQAQAQGQGHSR